MTQGLRARPLDIVGYGDEDEAGAQDSPQDDQTQDDGEALP